MSITRSAILAVLLVLVPLSPTGLDIDRLRPTWEALAEIEPTHPLGLAVGVLLTNSAAAPGLLPGGPRGTDLSRLSGDGNGDPAGGVAVCGQFGTSPAELGAYDDLLVELNPAPGEPSE